MYRFLLPKHLSLSPHPRPPTHSLHVLQQNRLWLYNMYVTGCVCVCVVIRHPCVHCASALDVAMGTKSRSVTTYQLERSHHQSFNIDLSKRAGRDTRRDKKRQDIDSVNYTEGSRVK